MIVLLSDFQCSEYAGVVKGVIYTYNPKAQIVDLQNCIEPQNIRQGSWVLKSNYKFFPKGTVFLCVVDPDVGGKRKNIAIQTRNYWFVGPDNGLITPSAKEDEIVNVYEIEIPKNWKVSDTFYGRDVFARIAAQVDKRKRDNLKKINSNELQEIKFYLNHREGEIANLDCYGNIITNVPPLGKNKYKVRYDGMEALVDYHRNYESARQKELFLVTGSSNTLEFSVKNASALKKFETILAQPIIGKKITIE